MAATWVRHVRYFVPNYSNFKKILEPLVFQGCSSRFIKTETELIEGASVEDSTEQIEDEDIAWELKRNKSRLTTQHRNILFNELPYSEAKSWHHHSVKYKQMMYGRYGEKSGVNPGMLWPTKEELTKMKAYEKTVYSKSVQEMMTENERKKKEEADAIKAREDEIMKKIVKLEQWKAELNARIAKKLADAQAAKDRKDRLIEEVRRHFGFKIDPRDERFKEMLEKKEKMEKKSVKEAKKKAKEAKLMSKLALQTEGTDVQPEDSGLVADKPS